MFGIIRVAFFLSHVMLPAALITSLVAGCEPAIHLEGDDTLRECAPPEGPLEAVEGSHLLIRPGGADVDNPSAALSGSVLGVAFQEKQGSSRALRLGLATLDEGGEPGEFVFSDLAESEKTLKPLLVSREEGFALLWIEYEQDGLYPAGNLMRAFLDAAGRIEDGPTQEVAGPCTWIDAAWSGELLSYACTLAGQEEFELKAGAAAPGEPPCPALTVSLGTEPISAPEIVWDDEAFDLFFEKGNALDASGRVEMARIDASADAVELRESSVIDAWSDGSEYLLSGPGALWTGDSVMLVYYFLSTDARGMNIVRLDRSGAAVEGPSPVDSGSPHGWEPPDKMELNPIDGGFLVSTTYCLHGDEASYSGFELCPIDGGGTLLGPCSAGSGMACAELDLPVDLSVVRRGASLDLFFDEDFYWPLRTKGAVFRSTLDPASFELSEPLPLRSPVGDLVPVAASCEERVCRVFGYEQDSRLLDQTWDDKIYGWFIVDRESGLVDLVSAGVELEYDWYARSAGGKFDETLAILVGKDFGYDQAVLLLADDGSTLWSLGLGDMTPHFSETFLFVEENGYRLIYPSPGLDAIYHARIDPGGRLEESVPLEGLDIDLTRDIFVVEGRGGVYFSGVLDEEERRFTLLRFDPREGDAFVPFADGSPGENDARYYVEPFMSDALVGARCGGGVDHILTWWDAGGSLLGRCRMESDFAGLGIGNDLAALLIGGEDTPFPGRVMRLAPSPASPRWNILDGHGAALDRGFEGSSGEICSTWRDEGTGDVSLSCWPLPQP